MKENTNTKINQYHSDVNPDEIWAAIEPRVDALNAKKKKKRRGLLFLFGGLGFIVLSSVVLSSFNNQEITTVEVDTESLRTEKYSRSAIEQANNEAYQIKIEKQTAQNNSEQIKALTNNNEIQNKLKEKSVQERKVITTQPASYPTAFNNKNEDTGINTPNTSDKSEKEKIKEFIQHSLSNNVKEKNRVGNVSDQGILEEEHAQRQRILDEPHSHLTNKIKQTATAKNETQTIEEEELKQVQIESVLQEKEQAIDEIDEQLKLNNTVSSITTLEIEKISRQEGEVNYTPLIVAQRKTAIQKQEQPFVLGLGVHGGAFSINRNMTTTAQSTTYLNRRLDTETPLEALAYGINLLVEHQSGLSLSLGYNRTYINERFDSRHMTRDTTWVNDVEYLVVNLMDDTVQVYGQIPEINDTISTYKVYNQYRIVELPIIIGYHHQVGKWKLGGHAGVLANVSLATKGRIFDENNNVIELNAGEKHYKKSISLGYQFGVSVERMISEQLSFRLAPTVKIYPNVMEGEQQISTKYSLFGAQAGIYYRFN